VSDSTWTYRLRATLGLYGLTAADLARRTGIDEGHLSRVRNGKIRPTATTVERIAIAIRSGGIEAEGAANLGEVA